MASGWGPAERWGPRARHFRRRRGGPEQIDSERGPGCGRHPSVASRPSPRAPDLDYHHRARGKLAHSGLPGRHHHHRGSPDAEHIE